MNTGFTGTRRGMTAAQKNIANGFLSHGWMPGDSFRHGDCVGADFEAATMARLAGFYIIGHIPTISSARAFFKSDIEMPALPYLERNHEIVDRAGVMLATPGEMNEVLRSGTWATIRYAIKKRKKICIIYPDGTSEVR